MCFSSADAWDPANGCQTATDLKGIQPWTTMFVFDHLSLLQAAKHLPVSGIQAGSTIHVFDHVSVPQTRASSQEPEVLPVSGILLSPPTWHMAIQWFLLRPVKRLRKRRRLHAHGKRCAFMTESFTHQWSEKSCPGDSGAGWVQSAFIDMCGHSHLPGGLMNVEYTSPKELPRSMRWHKICAPVSIAIGSRVRKCQSSIWNGSIWVCPNASLGDTKCWRHLLGLLYTCCRSIVAACEHTEQMIWDTALSPCWPY